MSVEDRIALSELKKLEIEIEKGFISANMALFKIHSESLYLTTHPSFEEYVKDRWAIGRQQAYKIIESTRVAVELSHICDSRERNNVPKVQAQLLELSKAGTVEDQREVIKVAAEKAAETGKPITASSIRSIVKNKQQSAPKQEDVELSDDDDDGEVLDMQARPETPIETPDHPKHLHGPIAAQVKAVNSVLTQVRSLHKQVGGEWLDVDGIERQVVLIRKSLRNAMYWADCPHCEKKGCNRCLKTGYFPEDRKKFLTPDESAVML